MATNYLIAAWSGNRFRRHTENHCLQAHINHLNTVKHSLAQVTIGYPENPREAPEYRDYVSSLKQLDDGTPIVVVPMVNEGLSYGQWSRMYDAFRDQFSHYIFIEDDYVPVQDGFDEILVQIFERESCGFLCGLFAKKGDSFGHGSCSEPHSAISNGISSNEVLKVVHGKEGLHKKNCETGRQQVEFSNKFMESGYQIKDYLSDYRCLYWPHRDMYRMYWNGKQDEDLIVPLQYLDNKHWQIEKYIREKELMRPAGERVAKQVPPQVLKQIEQGRDGIRRALERQRRIAARRK
jgi:hypothetical protein